MLKRNRVASFLLMPVAVFLWGIGWCLFWTGSKRDTAKPRAKPKLSVQNELVIFVPAPEQSALF